MSDAINFYVLKISGRYRLFDYADAEVTFDQVLEELEANKSDGYIYVQWATKDQIAAAYDRGVFDSPVVQQTPVRSQQGASNSVQSLPVTVVQEPEYQDTAKQVVEAYRSQGMEIGFGEG